MEGKLKITRILALIAIVIFAGSLFLPYVKYNVNPLLPKYIVDILPATGIEREMYYAFIYIFPILIFSLLKHSTLMKWLTFIFVCLLSLSSGFWIREISNKAFGYQNLEFAIGFYLFFLSNILFLITSIIKFKIPVPKKSNENGLLDDFLSQPNQLIK